MRTRLRTLHADGRRYTWRAEIRYVAGARHVRVRAWGSGKNGRALQVDLRPTSEDWYPDAPYVRTLIADALAEGWAPDTAGGTFTLSDRAMDVRSRGFTHEAGVGGDGQCGESP